MQLLSIQTAKETSLEGSFRRTAAPAGAFRYDRHSERESRDRCFDRGRGLRLVAGKRRSTGMLRAVVSALLGEHRQVYRRNVFEFMRKEEAMS